MVKKSITNLFDITRTDKPSYTKILAGNVVSSGKSRRPYGKVVWISPMIALKNSYAKTDVSKEKIRHPQFKPESFKQKFPVPYIDTLNKTGYGRGRMLLCKSWGVKEIPVLIVARSEKDVDKWVLAKKPKEVKE